METFGSLAASEESMVAPKAFGAIDVTPEAIWKEKKRAAEVVLPFGFIPHGWEVVTDE